MSDTKVVENETVVADVKEPITETDSVKTENTIPYSRFKEVNDKLKEYETKLAKRDSDEETHRKAELEKQGEYKQLLAEAKAEIDSLKPYKEKLDGYVADRRDVLVSKLPESKREKYTNAPLDILEEIVEDFTKASPRAGVSNQQASRFGGFESLTEWARKDPQGYKKFHRNNKGITLGYSS